jgi:hypothetical protein
VYPVLWDSFQEGLRDRLKRGPEMNMKDEAGLGLAVHWVQQALISASGSVREVSILKDMQMTFVF